MPPLPQFILICEPHSEVVQSTVLQVEKDDTINLRPDNTAQLSETTSGMNLPLKDDVAGVCMASIPLKAISLPPQYL